MPRQQGLLRRGGRYYCNIKVPKTLREALGKEHIREALKTSDYREACRRVVYENMRWKGFFEEEQRKAATLAASLAFDMKTHCYSGGLRFHTQCGDEWSETRRGRRVLKQEHSMQPQ